ncbi:prenyltransferase/squalene oxidase repeat-containing protein [Streptomyces coeruleoprunus]|uniref:Prenyltransferase/squalene oxidase repeat-containing protein n=1 Tax=Streptomyces coeruleoprunus TaxID=285563 RepID=A0ABV9X812_9ACTN
MTTVRRRAAALAAVAVLGTGIAGALAPAASAAPSPGPAPKLPAGLYGTKDPTYDGVWRQSLAFMAQQVSGVEPAPEAVGWLLGQQCDNGGFTAYRADATKPCAAATPLDTNATAVALQALDGVDSHEERVPQAMERAARWLKGAQNHDGGWGYNPGSPSDANSTSLVVSALAAIGQEPGTVRSASGKSPYDALLTFALPCDAKSGGGAFAYQPAKDGTLVANDDATAAAVLAGLGKHLLVKGVTPQQKPTCETAAKPTAERAARNGAAHLAAALAKTGHLNLPPMPGATAPADQPDVGNTADAVIALGAAGHGEEAAGAVAWLRANGPAWAKEGGPAAYAQLILAAHTAGADARDFGGTDLVRQLEATGPEPASTPESRAREEAEKHEESGFGVWLIVGVLLVAGMGIGFLLNGRTRKPKP